MTDEHGVVAAHPDLTGEGPLWHPDDHCLYWVDIPDGELFRYDPEADRHECCYRRDGPIGGFTVQSDGSLLLFEEGGRIESWDDGVVGTIHERIEGEEGSRFNDVIADPQGRVFCGTMPIDGRLGRLYRVDPDGTVHELADEVNLPNGMGFSPDRQSLYLTESYARRILRYEYDEATGALTSPDTFVTVPDGEGEGVPDGLTVDAAGCVWSARWDGGCLVRYDPSGTELRRVSFPARKLTSLAFGGRTYLDAYVTSARPIEASESGEGDAAGALFRTDLGVRGVPEFSSEVVTE